MAKDAACNHTSTVVANPVEGGGWRAHCLVCGRLGSVGRDSAEAPELIRDGGNTDLHPARRRSSPANRTAGPARRWSARRL